MKLLMWVLISFYLVNATAIATEMEYYNETAQAILPNSATLEKLADGYAWVEGPAWNEEGQYLVFSDIPNNVIWKWKEGEGTSLYLQKSGYTDTKPFLGKEPGSNGLAWDKEGSLLICEHGNRRVTRLAKDGTKTIIADSYQGLRLNSPNDVIVANNGDVFFTDPPYGLAESFEDPNKELHFQGLYKWSNRQLELLTDQLKAPNGLGFSPDGKTLYVSNSEAENPVWYAFDYDGKKVSNKKVLASAKHWVEEGHQGLPDGFAVNRDGYLFAAGPGGLYIISPEGIIVAFINFGHPVSNCTWGSTEDVLYITGNHAIYRLKLL